MAGESREPDADLTPEGGTGEAGSAGGAVPPGRGDTTPGTGAPAIPPAVADLFARLEAEPWRFHPYTAMRLLEAAHPGKPRFGQTARLKDDPVRFGQEPSLAFAPSPLASFTWRGPRPPRLDTFFLGVFGPNGPLPLHLTEYARERERNHGDATLRRFADIFHHRYVQLFYRAWADSQPVTHADRPDDDRFALYVGGFGGLGLESLRGCDVIPDETRLHWAGLFAMPSRPAEGLARILSGYLEIPVRIEECVGHWIRLPRESLSRLGTEHAALGTAATLGEQVWDCASKFRVVAGPVDLETFRRLLPGTQSLERVRAIVRAWVGDELWWDLNVLLEQAHVPATRLDERCGLGRTTWLLSAQATHDADDYVFEPVSLAG
jgi:type VI secretion system protein ImpH